MEPMHRTDPADRRTDERELSEAFSPEYLAMLVICGGTVRDSDWDLLPETVAARRPGRQEEPATEAGHGEDDTPPQAQSPR